MSTMIFQVFIDEQPQRKHFKHCSYSSGRLLGIKRQFKKHAQKSGFTELVDDNKSWIEYSYQDENGKVMSLRFVGEEDKD